MFPLVLLASCGRPAPTLSGDAPSLAYGATAVGRIDSFSESRNLVAAADGVIKTLFVERGQHIKAGQALLAVDCAPRQAQITASQAEARRAHAAAALVDQGVRAEELAAARATLAAAAAVRRNQQQRLDLAAALIGRGFISRRELDARTAERDAAAAEMAAQQSRLAALEHGARPAERRAAAAAAQAGDAMTQLANAAADQCVLRSPIDGDVLQILRREGEFSGATQGTSLIVVGDQSRAIIRAEVGERDAAQLRLGLPADIWLDGEATKWHGHVIQLAQIMGRRSARSLDPTDRFDRDVREAIISFDGPTPPKVVGLRVTVGFRR